MNKRKKGISPVVSIALLLVVAVVAVIGFQNWFGMYSSDIFVKAEKESQSSSGSVGIETIVGDQLYVKGGDNLSINKILIDGNDCSISLNISGVENINLGDCLDSLSTNSPEIVIISDDKVISKKIYLKDSVTTSQSLSSSVYTDTFISVWNTSVFGTGTVSSTAQIELPLEVGGTYDFVVSGTNLVNSPVTITSHSQRRLNFTTSGLQEINITGQIQGFRFGSGGDRRKLLEIKAWGPLNLGNNGAYFDGADKFFFSGNDDLNLTGTTNLESMFFGADNFNGDISSWDVSQVTNMSNMFRYAYRFNSPINNWDVGNVIDMSQMFAETQDFNQPLGNWDVSSVTSMNSMFDQTSGFNQNLNSWDVSSVTDMASMFGQTSSFNQPLNNWNVSSVTDIRWMFHQAQAFNQPLNNWDVSSITDMYSLFSYAYDFNQPLNNWNVSNVQNMTYTFTFATSFNQDLSSWDVDQVVSCNLFNDTTPAWSLSQPNFTSCTP